MKTIYPAHNSPKRTVEHERINIDIATIHRSINKEATPLSPDPGLDLCIPSPDPILDLCIENSNEI